MKGIVNCYLNVRTQKASVNSPNVAYLKPGDVVEIVDILNGDNYEGNDLWFQLSNGTYVWSGGVDGNKALPAIHAQPASKVLIDYNSSFKNIPAAIRNTKGESIKVAVLDTGIDIQHAAFKGEIKGVFDALTGQETLKDSLGHGTHCAGLIGARNELLERGVLGIAPKVEMYAAKVATDRDVYYLKNVVKGLQWAIEVIKADIINLSFSIIDFDSADKTEFNRLVTRAYQNNQVLIAAAGENELLLTSHFRKFNNPAMVSEIISIGAIDESILRRSLLFNPKLDFMMPFKNFYSSIPNQGFEGKRGSSMACALFSGIASLYLSNKSNQENSLEYIKKCINNIATPFSKEIDFNFPSQIFKP